MPSHPDQTIAFQGLPGAYSDLACRAAFPRMATLPCPSFEDAFAAVRSGDAKLAMIPIENSLAGRVADIHHLMPESGLHIVGEHFQRVNHCLIGHKGAKIDALKTVSSHVQALSQCRNFIRQHGLKPIVRPDTAGSASELAQGSDKSAAAIPILRARACCSWRPTHRSSGPKADTIRAATSDWPMVRCNKS